MRYTQGVDEQGNAIDVVDPMLAEFQKINAQYRGADRVKALLGLSGIFADHVRRMPTLSAVTAAYQAAMLANAVRASVWLRCN